MADIQLNSAPIIPLSPKAQALVLELETQKEDTHKLFTALQNYVVQLQGMSFVQNVHVIY